MTAPSEPYIEITVKDILREAKALLTLDTEHEPPLPPPPPPAPPARSYISYVHYCGRCGVVFRWPSRPKLFCPSCAKLREKAHWARSNRKRWAKKEPLTGGVSARNTCARCGTVVNRRKRFCKGCRRVRQMDGDARRKRLKMSVSRPAFNADSVPAAQFAPALTKGGEP